MTSESKNDKSTLQLREDYKMKNRIYLHPSEFIEAYTDIADTLMANYHNILDYEGCENASPRDTEIMLDCIDVAETILYNLNIVRATE